MAIRSAAALNLRETPLVRAPSAGETTVLPERDGEGQYRRAAGYPRLKVSAPPRGILLPLLRQYRRAEVLDRRADLW